MINCRIIRTTPIFADMKTPQKIFYFLIVLTFSTLSVYSQEYSTNSSFNIKEYDATIYPNPVVDEMFYVKSEAVIKRIEVINVIGQTVAKVNNNTKLPYNLVVRLPNCNKGIYMVKILFDNNKKSVIKKILVK